MKQKIIYKENKKTYSYSIKVNEDERRMLKYLKENKIHFSKMVKKLLFDVYEEVSK